MAVDHFPVRLLDGEYQFDFSREPRAFQVTASGWPIHVQPTWLAKMREAREWLEARRPPVDDWFVESS